MEKTFRIDGVKYRLGITPSGNVWLDLIGGATKKGSARPYPGDLFWDVPNFKDVDLNIDTFKVFNVVKKFLLEYVFAKRPGRIGFSASTTRKIRIYRWMAQRLARQLNRYNLVEYPAGEFNFYKRAEPAGSFGGECSHVDC